MITYGSYDSWDAYWVAQKTDQQERIVQSTFMREIPPEYAKSHLLIYVVDEVPPTFYHWQRGEAPGEELLITVEVRHFAMQIETLEHGKERREFFVGASAVADTTFIFFKGIGQRKAVK